ncbi:MAG: hypothetical protein QNK37_21995 [Acidobacteriota bacterium]|nr:hypothetical protein [Acidobacteriota bacterium]
MGKDLLAKEWETYLANKEELLANHKGRCVLIKDNRILDIFDSQQDAVNSGTKRLGLVPFLAHRIVEQEETYLLTYNIVET